MVILSVSFEADERFEKRLTAACFQLGERIDILENEFALSGPAGTLPLHCVPERVQCVAKGFRILRRNGGKITSPEFVSALYSCAINYVDGSISA